MTDIASTTLRRVNARLLPLLIAAYLVAYLDRVNVGFAALTMNQDLGISAAAFGLGSGIFFLTYFLFEVPSNLFLERVGARLWIARIMFTWGILSGAMAFITGEKSFYLVRLLLGAAEAGFFPGIIFYLTLWYPAEYRARIVGYFMAAIPLSSVIGSPISGLLLGMDGLAGLKGWQWLFILEAAPSLILAVVVILKMTDRPSEAAWLEPEQRDWLTKTLEAERRRREAARSYGVMEALLNPKVLALSLVYFSSVAAIYGLSFFLPQIIKAFGLTNAQTGFVTLIPYAVATVGMVWWGRRSDAKRERKGHEAFALGVAAAGLVGAALVDDPYLKMVFFSVSAFGTYSALPVFWTLPTAFLSGAAAAGGIAIINALGNLSGFVGPYVMGYVKDATGSFTGGLLAIAAAAAVGMVVVLLLHHDHALERGAPRDGRVA